MKGKFLTLLGILAVSSGSNAYGADDDSLTEKQKWISSGVRFYKGMKCSDSEASNYAKQDYLKKEKIDKRKKKLIKHGLSQHDVDQIIEVTSGFTTDKRTEYIAKYQSRLACVEALKMLEVSMYPDELLQFLSKH